MTKKWYFLRQRHDLLEERPVDDRGRRVVRVVEDQDLGPGEQALADPRDVGEERLRVADVERDHVGRGQGDGVDVDREARRRDQRRVARPEQGQAHVAEPLLRADRGDDLVVGVEAHAEPLLVLRGDLAAEVVDARRDAVAVVLRVARRLAELVDDPGLGRVGRVAHAQVDDVDARRAACGTSAR